MTGLSVTEEKPTEVVFHLRKQRDAIDCVASDDVTQNKQPERSVGLARRDTPVSNVYIVPKVVSPDPSLYNPFQIKLTCGRMSTRFPNQKTTALADLLKNGALGLESGKIPFADHDAYFRGTFRLNGKLVVKLIPDETDWNEHLNALS